MSRPPPLSCVPALIPEPARREGSGGAPGEDPVRADEMTRVTVRILLQVILVLGFGLPERAGGSQFGHRLARPETRRIDVCDGVFRNGFLLVIEVENGGAVAFTAIISLPIQRTRIVDLEEELQDLAIADLRRIELDLDRLGMAAVVTVGGVRYVAAGITDARGDHAGLLTDQVLHPPETTAGENGS